MKRGWLWLLYAIGIGCLAIALSYPIRYALEARSVDEGMDRLRQLKRMGEQAQESDAPESNDAKHQEKPDPTTPPTSPEPPVESQSPVAGEWPDAGMATEAAESIAPETTPRASVSPRTEASPRAEATDGSTSIPSGDRADNENLSDEPPEEPAEPIDRRARTKEVQPYPIKEKISLDVERILPKYREIYDQNNDFVGWLQIEGTVIDYPVLQNEDGEYYLRRDFYGEENANGQLILDSGCDPLTPSYNLIISGHNMQSGMMFGNLTDYKRQTYWQRHKYLRFDTLIEEKTYVVIAAFYSADYDEDEEGFRYNADIQYAIDLEEWQKAIKANQLYETGIEAEYGDEFLTLTTCSYQRKDGRFVVIARRLRDGEGME